MLTGPRVKMAAKGGGERGMKRWGKQGEYRQRVWGMRGERRRNVNVGRVTLDTGGKW